MNSIRQVAEHFFEACETGKGWDGCKQYCRPDATFSCQAEALADVKSVQAYTAWMAGLTMIMPDARYDIHSFAVDEDRNNVTVFATYHGTHTEEGGPVPPTGRRVASDYTYTMEFDGDRIRHMTKVWNAPYAMKELGWA